MVGDDQLNGVLFKQMQGIVTTGCGQDLIILVDKNPPQGFEDIRFVIDEQNGVGIGW